LRHRCDTLTAFFCTRPSHPDLPLKSSTLLLATMADEVDTTQITVTSNDGTDFTITSEAAKNAGFFKDMLFDEDNAPLPNMFQEKVVLKNVASEPLRFVVEFLSKYLEEPMKEIPVPLDGDSFEEVRHCVAPRLQLSRSIRQIMTQEWYQNFISVDKLGEGMLYKVLTAANFLHIQPLLDLACLRVTFDLQGKSAEEVRNVYICLSMSLC